MNTRDLDLNPSIEEARERINDGQGEVSVSTMNYPIVGKTRVTVTFSITVDAVEKGGGSI